MPGWETLLLIVACPTFPSKITGCDRLQVGAATGATSIISRLADIAVLGVDLHSLGNTFPVSSNLLNCPVRYSLTRMKLSLRYTYTAQLRSHNLIIKELPQMILDKFATQRQATELVSWSEE